MPVGVNKFGWLTIIVVAAMVADTASAGDRLATATLPQGNEAALLSSRARDAIQVGDFEVAIRLIERIAALPESLVPVTGGRTYYPTWREALRLQALLPADGVKQYQMEFDALVGARRDTARENFDLGALRALFERYQASRHWSSLAGDLAALYLDQGRYAEAYAILQLLPQLDRDAEPDVGKSVIALARVGAIDRARQQLERSAEAQVSDEQRRALAKWLAVYSTRNTTAVPDQYSLQRAGEFSWTIPAQYDDFATTAASATSDVEYADAVDYLRRLPLLDPQLADDNIFVRMNGRIFAFDALSLLPRWSVSEQTTTIGGPPTSTRDRAPADAARIVANPLAHTLQTAFDRLYSIESVPQEPEANMQFGWGGMNPTPGVNLLVARDPQTGSVLWELGADRRHSLFQVAFQDRPVAVGENICVVYQRKDDLEIARLDPATGDVLQTATVIGPPTYFSTRGGRVSITADDSTIYVSTGNGVLAAVDGHTLRWRWATKYPSLLTPLRGRRWWNRNNSLPPEFGLQRPVIAGDLVIFAPADAEQIIAVDRFTGRVRWQLDNRAAYPAIVGAVPRGLVLVGHAVTCIALENGRDIRWRSVPLEIVGRPIIDAERVWVPTRTGVLALDATTGKAVQASQLAGLPTSQDTTISAADDAVIAFALRPVADGLIAVSPNGLTKYAECDTTRRLGRERLDRVPSSAEAAFALAWCDVLSGNWQDAIASLQHMRGDGIQFAQARESLLMRAFVGMARSSSDSQQQLEWLNQALAMDVSPTAAAKLALLIGSVMESERDAAEAARHWLDIIFTAPPVTIADAQAPQLQRAPQSIATMRLQAIVANVDKAVRAELLADCVKRIAAQGNAIQQSLRCFDRPAERAAILTAASQAGLPYELFALFDDESVALDDVAANDRVRYALERWAAAVAVGDRDAANAAKQAYEQIIETTEADAINEDLQRLQNLTRVNHNKMQNAIGDPFTTVADLSRWRANGVTALPATGTDDVNPFLWVNKSEFERYELLAVHSGATFRRASTTIGSTSVLDAFSGSARDLLENLQPGRRGAAGSTLRHLVHENITVVMNDEGIVALGNAGFAPARRGGTRLWARPGSIVGNDREKSQPRLAAAPAGVFVLESRGALALLDWQTGNTLWTRQIADVEMLDVITFDDVVIAVSRDLEWFSFDAVTGEALSNSRPLNQRAHSITKLGDAFVVFYDREVVALDPRSGSVRWKIATQKFQWYVADPVGGIVLLRGFDGGAWRVLDTRTGTALELPQIAGSGEPIKVAREQDRLFVVEREERNGTSVLHYKSYDLAARELSWQHEVPADAIPTRSMFVGNPNCVVALVQPQAPPDDPRPVHFLGLQLIDKESGNAAEPIVIGPEFTRGGRGPNTPRVFVTPTRILVELQGILAAWGPSSWSEGE